MSMNPIEIKGLTAGYNGNAIIENIDLTLYKRDFLAIIGPNGGGKSTLLKTILGLIKPMSGCVEIFGEEPEKGVTRIGYVPQNGAFDPSYPISVEEVALMGLRSKKGLRPTYDRDSFRMARDAMEIMGISNLAHKKIGDLSGGQIQRTLMARALAPQPDILLLDEPMASLDPTIKDCIYDAFRKINDKVAILMVTHDMGIISTEVKRVACLNRTILVHDEPLITPEMMKLGFHCPMELIAHGVPHRVLEVHPDD